MNRVRLTAVCLILVAAQWALNAGVKNLDTAWVELPPGAGEQWNPELFKALTCGHVPTAVDWLWLKSLQDMSLTKVPKGTHPSLYYDLELATDLDHAYFDAYVNGANLLSIIRDDSIGARDLLLKAERFRKEELPTFPEAFQKNYWAGAWYPSFVLAYLYMFELNDLPSAALAFQEAARIDGVPAYVKSLAERLMKRGGTYAVGVRLLTFLMAGQKDPKVKEELQRKRDSLLVAQYIFNANDAFQFYLNSLPSYRNQQKIEPEKLEKYWASFRREQNFPSTDPWSGTLKLSPDGRIVTSTPYDRVLGLD